MKNKSTALAFLQILVPPIVGLSLVIAAATGVILLLYYEVQAFAKMPIGGQNSAQSVSLRMISTADENSARQLIKNFYEAWDGKDGKTLFGHMTPPLTMQEKGEYDWLTAGDMSNSFFRAFDRARIQNPIIYNIHQQKNGAFGVLVSDELQVYSNADPIGWSSAGVRRVKFTVLRNSAKGWLIDEFMLLEGPTGTYKPTDKYSGFPNIDSN